MKIQQLLSKFERKAEKISDVVAYWSGKPLFLICHIIWWAGWIWGEVEPFPYGLLTMILSLEAIVLSALILSASNRVAEKDRKMMIEEYELTEETSEIIDRIATDIVKIKLILDKLNDKHK